MKHEPVRYRRSSEALERSFGGEVLLALPEREDVELLSGTASSVWLLLAAPTSAEDIVKRLARDFAVDLETVKADVEPLLRQLERGGWIERIAHGDD